VNPRIGVFGKLPAAGDFVANNATLPVARGLQDWLVGEIEHLFGKRRKPPAVPIRFLARDPSGSGACLGVASPSRDKVGREFPIVVLTYVDVPVATNRFASLPAAYAPFLDQAAALLVEAAAQDVASVMARADALPLPGPRELEDARTWTQQALEQTAGQTILEALFGPLSQGVHYHGINLFLVACEQVRGGDPGQASIILDCPAKDDVQLAFWLRFAQDQLQWRRAPPSLFWTTESGPGGRLLIALGAPPLGVLHFLGDPTLAADRLWPMRTANPNAVDAGRRGLNPLKLRALEPPAPSAAALLMGLVG
jgi:type VI secretion system protein ImpM